MRRDHRGALIVPAVLESFIPEDLRALDGGYTVVWVSATCPLALPRRSLEPILLAKTFKSETTIVSSDIDPASICADDYRSVSKSVGLLPPHLGADMPHPYMGRKPPTVTL